VKSQQFTPISIKSQSKLEEERQIREAEDAALAKQLAHQMAMDERKITEKRSLQHDRDLELARQLSMEENQRIQTKPKEIQISTTFISKEPISLLTCTICFDPIKALKTLSCSHQFCGSCIFKWTNEYATQCPVCQVEITSIEGFPVVPRKQRVVYDDEINMRPTENIIDIPSGVTKISITVIDERKTPARSVRSPEPYHFPSHPQPTAPVIAPPVSRLNSPPPSTPSPSAPPPYAPSLPPPGVVIVNPPKGVNLPPGCVLTKDGSVLDSTNNYKFVGRLKSKK